MKSPLSGKRNFLIIAIIFLSGIFLGTLLSKGNQSEVFQTEFNKENQEIPIKPTNIQPTSLDFKISPAKSNLALAKVIRVIDGDTIEVEIDGSKKTVRYIGIDTPETVHPDREVQCFGKEASEKNKELVTNKTVELEKDVSEGDRYGRLLRYVYVDNVFVNEVLVREGYAHASSYPPDIKYQDKFRLAEQQARKDGMGLWGNVCELQVLPTTKPVSGGSYTCDCGKSCSEISSCEEAQYQLNTCGCSVRDGDRDGIACDGAPLACQQ